MIVAAADGSSLANPGPSGWAWYIDKDHWAAGGWPRGTNNMGELTAVLELLRATKDVDEPLRILCDSQYAINCCTRWIPAWKKRGWRKADNKPVQNLDLVKQLDEELAGRRVTFQWVRGHTGHALNERADELARAAATAYRDGTPVQVGPGFSRSEHGDGSSVRHVHQDDVSLVDDEILPDGGMTGGAGGMTGGAGLTTAGLTPEPLVWPQPDLLSVASLVRPERDAANPNSPLVVDIAELTRELLSDETQLDRERLAELMHPDFVAHLPGGLIRTRGSLLARPASLLGSLQLDVLGADELDDKLVLLRYRMKRNSQEFLCAILWQRTTVGWQARFHQVTAVTA